MYTGIKLLNNLTKIMYTGINLLNNLTSKNHVHRHKLAEQLNQQESCTQA